jgi:predicted RNase H-like HicB family nuclease
MKDYGYELFWSDEDDGYIVTCPDFPGLSAFGETPGKALKEASLAMELFIEDYEKRGEQLPEPTKITSYSGQIRLRMPKNLHAAVSKAAAKAGVSLNTYLVGLLSERNALNELAAGLDGKLSEILEKMERKDDEQFPHRHVSVVVTERVLAKYDLSKKGVYYGKVTHNN